MKYEMTKPCNNCPFLKVGGIPLHSERAREIARCATDSQGATFACHKTTKEGHDGEMRTLLTSQHCAGALIFAEKHETANQMNRIAMRLGIYNPDKLDRSVFDDVFDDEEEMVEAQIARGER